MAWYLGPADPTKIDSLTSHIMSLDHDSDRAVAIVAAAMVEMHLTNKLRQMMHYDKVIHKALFRSDGPLGDFGTRINLAFVLGLISEEFRRELTTMKEIRNAFAHQLEVKDFGTERIKALCRNLKLFEAHCYDPNVLTTAKIQEAWKAGKEAVKGVGIGIPGLEEKLKLPRHRYIICAQVFSMMFGFMQPKAPPQPKF